MQRERNAPSVVVLAFAAAIIIASFIASFFARQESEVPQIKSHLKAVIELESMTDTTRALVVGYNHHLLDNYAADNGRTVDISVSRQAASWLDSLRRGSVDIVAVPFGDSLKLDSLVSSKPIDSLFVWVVNAEDTPLKDEIDIWIDSWHESEEHEEIKNNFTRRFDAYRSRRRASISPYDSLIKTHADSLGWDWRLLAAVIYQESRFHIEARSSRGASGLMQMMPRTAERYGVTDPLDPEENIRAGAQLLGRLIKRYSNVGANEDETYKYALAAYNAGVGRVDDILRLAELRGVDTSEWEKATSVIPEMNDESVVDTGAVRLGVFKGRETIAYVRRVMDIYSEFKRICP